MSSQLGPIDIQCDAPPYSVVRAGHRIGLRMPEDVRWCRLSHFSRRLGGRPLFSLQTWKALLGLTESGERSCTCGQHLPSLERYTFTFRNGTEASYLLGQCGHCRTVFWEEA